ncbi:MAG: type IV secretory system conjugative DNA transfer family protein [Alphaproteobacteria bacterium]|nr:type IV secretory system conjugative DNA transfer family protein [Rickettsiales bacterium]
MKNAAGLFLVYFGTIVAVFYISTAVMLFAVNGKDGVLRLFSLDFFQQVVFIVKVLRKYFSWWYTNWEQVGLTGFNYFTFRLFSPFVVFFGILFGIVIKFWYQILDFRITKKESSLYGDAHWSTQSEIRKVGLRAKKGLLVGVDKKGYLIADGYQHILLFAPTGAGKGVGFVIPNLLFWDNSAFCHDIKLENYELTSGWRANYLKQKVFVWEPSNPSGVTNAYNPIDWLSNEPGQMVDDVQKFANLILQKKEFWENEARTLLVGVLLYLVADKTKIKSFGEVVRTLRGDDFAYTVAVALDTLGDVMHPVGYMNLAAFLQKADKERSGCVSTLNSGLELWANPIIDAATASSDFDIRTFRKVRSTVYVGLTPDNIQRLRSLMSMFYQQATDFLSNKMPAKDEPYGVLFLMDEFPTLGKMEQFLAGIAYFRGYRVRLFLIVQDTQQLKGAYEDSGMNSFLSNSTYRITFAANNIETARLISDLVGNYTAVSESRSKSKIFSLGSSGSSGGSISATQRALLLPQEVISLPRTDQIILIEAAPPIQTRKILYYKDKRFTSKLWDQIKLPKQKPIVIRRPPAKDVSADEKNNDQDSNEQQGDVPEHSQPLLQNETGEVNNESDTDVMPESPKNVNNDEEPLEG